MPLNEPSEVFKLLGKRAHLLQIVIENNTIDRRDLVDELEESRTTIYRGLDQLENQDILHESNGIYTITNFGTLVYEVYQTYTNIITRLIATKDVVECIKDIEILDPEVLFGAETIVSDKREPERMINQMESVISGVNEVCVILPVIPPNYMEFICNLLDESKFHIEIIIETDVFDVLKDRHIEQTQYLNSSENALLMVTELDLPFGMQLVLDPMNKVQIIGFGPYGEIRGIIQNNLIESIDWAKETYMGLRDSAVFLEETRSRAVPS